MSPSDRSPPPARHEEQVLTWGHAQAVVAALAAIAGLGVYVYLLGGIVAWPRTVAARLPADNVTPTFENHALVAIGIKVLLFELVLLLAVAATIVTVREVIRRTERSARRHARSSRHRFNGPAADDDEDLLFALTIVFRALLVGLMLAALGSTTGALTESAWLGLGLVMAVAFGALELALRFRTALFVPLAMRSPSLGRYVAECATQLIVWAFIAEVVVIGAGKLAAPLGATVLVLLALLVLTHCAVAAGLDRAQLALPRRRRGRRDDRAQPDHRPLPRHPAGRLQTGDGDDTDRVAGPGGLPRAHRRRHLSGDLRRDLAGVAGEQAGPGRGDRRRRSEGTDAGGPRYTFDVGHRPTLFALAQHFLTGDDLAVADDGVSLDLRHRHETCFRYPGH